jgi:DedD protein
MDRRVKERLIGASILVVLIVLVVPELLSGPKLPPLPQPMLPAAAASEPNRTVMVDLSTSKPATASEPAEPTSQPASAVTVPPADPTPLPTPAAAPKPAHAPAVESVAAPPISPVRGVWSVQLGSFASRANADNLTRQMKGEGFPAFVLEGGSGKSVRYRVRVGPFPDRESAERTAAKLKALKHDSSLVAPAG